ncbi:hypothetical protein KL918_003314 [Ogataea parapolymorpha]|uniref:Alpha 1,6-mannosyltransferase n=1 Tax=Ogataea parapolymorpha (strain ATCC 26012 / BCRC 20466 / JCM 22074 / NRRL Y-7560 / DL-1) TaxID=871575 RepID=W1Q8T3_OGAPD|nr:alpha 1,6-mannosyltransferase [Ogataea parapolymorpha DL-1]ESW95755.1 alpha 1,6-mannosyltransferase [Ogataea parapolymorpha DL-1]KAG7866417.1 hypothetical protein KL918_003314 [Ogataea parapolymorpha]KAG7872647.1 hypothetical protein KL916_003042 [Ogataea parapolymorpha]
MPPYVSSNISRSQLIKRNLTKGKFLWVVGIAVFLFLEVAFQTSYTTMALAFNSPHLEKISHLTSFNSASNLSPIERKLLTAFPFEETEPEKNIFQLWDIESQTDDLPAKVTQMVLTWGIENPSYVHNVLEVTQAEAKVEEVLTATVPEVWEAYKRLPHARHKYEFLKYLLIYLFGGTYADVDVELHKPINKWYHPRMMFGRLYVGILGDLNEPNYDRHLNRRLTFSTNVFQARSRHPFLAKLIGRISHTSLQQSKRLKKIDWEAAFQNSDSTGEPTISFTGPSVFTDTLVDYLNNIPNAVHASVSKSLHNSIVGPTVPKSQRFSYKKFSQILAPSQVEDVVIYPQVSFQGPLDNQEDDNSNYFYAQPSNFSKWGYRSNLDLKTPKSG